MSPRTNAPRAVHGFTLCTFCLFALLIALPASSATIHDPADQPMDHQIPEPLRSSGANRVHWFWFDDLEPPDPGWTHGVDVPVPHFHVDTYMAYSGSHSWWCGTFDYDADGGYGNRWDDRLDIPPVDWSGYTYPVIMLYFRNDTQHSYDFTYVEAESNGVFVRLNGYGYDGTMPWQWGGFYLADMDNPAVCRFRFVSDMSWSDEDGQSTVGGAFMCDEIQIMDYYTGEVLFYDDVESGGLCTPSVPPIAGDYWHTISNSCKAWSDPTVWVNTQIDTPGYVPPGVRNWLMTPMVDISCATTCTVYYVYQSFTSYYSGDYWTEEVTVDGGATWTDLTQLDEWGPVFDQCEDYGYGPCDHFGGIRHDLTWLLPGTTLGFRWAYYSDENGAGPNECGNAGITLDDIGFFGETAGWPTPHIAVSDSLLSFGGVAMGATAALPLRVSNEGSLPLTVSDISADHSDFTADPASFVVPPCGNQFVSVEFTPSSLGPISATLTILSDDPDAGTLEVTLEGEGLLPPDIAVAPDSLYADLPTGGTDTQYLTIENTGPGELVWEAYAGPRARGREGRTQAARLVSESALGHGYSQSRARADLWPAADTALSQTDGGVRYVPWLTVDPASGTIPPGGTTEAAVTFDAYGLFGGDYRADLFILSNDPDEPEVSVATHLHVTGAPDIALSDTLLSYGQVFVTATAYETLEVANEGTDTLHVTAVAIDAPEFTTDTTPFALGDGGVRSLEVAFSPVTEGVVTGTLTIESDDPDEGTLEVALEGQGLLPPDIAVSPDSLYADLMTGEAETQYITIENSGESELVWEADAVPCAQARGNRTRTLHARSVARTRTDIVPRERDDGSRQAPWLTADPASGTLPPGGAVDVAVTFDASGLYGGDYLADLLILSNDPDEPEVPVATHLHVTGVPDIAVSDTLLTFGPVFIGWSGEITLLVLNEGTDQLTVSDISTNHGDFSAEPTSFGVSPGESQAVTVEFAPSSEGMITATLTILSDDPDEGALDVSLEGEGLVPPEVSVSPDSLDADLLTGETETQYVTIENTGGSELVWELDSVERVQARGHPSRTPDDRTGLRLETDSASRQRDGARQVPWLSADPASGTIPPGGATDVAVTFDAFGLFGGNYLADLLVLSNDPDDPEVPVAIHLHVTGAPDIALSDTVLSFGSAFIGWSATDTLVVSNEGTDQLTVTHISTDHGDFSAEPTSFGVPPGESQAVTVEFAPSSEGPISATLTILSNDPDEGVLEVLLEGEGLVPPEFTVSPDSLDADLQTGETETQYITIGNPGGSELVWRLGAVRATGIRAAPPESPRGAPPLDRGSEGRGTPRDVFGAPAPRGGGRIAELAGVRILWDRSHGQWGIAEHGIALQDLTDRGATVTVNHEQISAELLADYEIMWTADCANNWTAEEVDALASWVSSGGGLLLQGDYNYSVTAFNDILAALGAGIVYSTVDGTEGVTANIHPHPTTLDVDLIYLSGNIAHLPTVAAPASVLVDDTEGVANSAWSEVGSGRIVASADLLFDNSHITYVDNGLFASQVFDWLAGCAGWITVEPDAGAVPAGGSGDVAVIFEPGLLAGGDYLADVVLLSNDPLVPEVSIATCLHVTGMPDIAVSDTLLYFGVVEMGSVVSETLLVSNEGTAELAVADVGTDHGDFSADPTSFDLAPDESQAVVVEFAPSSEGPISGTLTIESNDPDEGTVEVMLFARGESVTPVESSFYAILTDPGTVMLRWVAPSLADIHGLNVYRATSQEGPFARVNEEMIPPASPGEYEDRSVWPETTFWYELRAVHSDGSEDALPGARTSATTGGRLVAKLHPAIPNPFTGQTTVQFDVPSHAPLVTLAIYDVRGRLVRKLVEGPMDRGRQLASWNGTDERRLLASAGVYFVRLQAGGQTETQKVVLLR